MLLAAFSSLRQRNFRLFLSGQFLSQCGSWIQTVAHGWLVLTLTDSPFVVGLVSTLGSLPILLFTLYGGVVADRVNKRHFIIVLQTGMLLEALALGILTQFGWITVTWVMILAAFFGLMMAFEVPVRQAFMVDLVGQGELMNAIALNSSAFNLSRVIGPVIAGGIIAVAGLAACFYANALSFVAVLAILFYIKMPEGDPPKEPLDLRRSLAEGLRYVSTERWPRTLVLLTATLSIFGFSFLTMLPVFARDVLDVGAAGYGLALAAVGVGAVTAALGVAAFGSRVRQGRTALASAGVLGFAITLMALLPYLLPTIVLAAIAGCAMAASGITTNTLLQRQSPDHLRGRVMGFYSFVALGMAPFGSLQAGWISEHLGVRASFAIGGTVCLLAVTGVVWWLKSDMARAAALTAATPSP